MTKVFKMVVISSGLALVLAVATLSTSQVVADEQLRKNKIASTDGDQKYLGTWILREASTPGSPSGIGTRLRMVTKTHWCILQPDPKTGELHFVHGGRYKMNGNVMEYTRDFAGKSTASMVGGKGEMTLKVEGDTMKQIDPNGVFNETWERME